MRKYVTIARKHDEKNFETVVGPEQEHRFHRKFLKPFRGKGTNEKFAEVYLCEAVRKMKFKPVAPASVADKKDLDQSPKDNKKPSEETKSKLIINVPKKPGVISKVFGQRAAAIKPAADNRA